MGGGEGECRDFGIKASAVVSQHLIGSVHGTDRGLQNGAGGVAESFPRGQVRLLSDNPFAVHFLAVLGTIENDPVPADQTRRQAAGVGDGDGVGENETAVVRFGLFREKLGLYLNINTLVLRG